MNIEQEFFLVGVSPIEGGIVVLGDVFNITRQPSIEDGIVVLDNVNECVHKPPITFLYSNDGDEAFATLVINPSKVVLTKDGYHDVALAECQPLGLSPGSYPVKLK